MEGALKAEVERMAAWVREHYQHLLRTFDPKVRRLRTYKYKITVASKDLL